MDRELAALRRRASDADADGAGGDIRPRPDPTVLTTQALQREVLSLKEFYEAKFASYDKAINLLQANADKAPSINVVDERVSALKMLHEEKFASISKEFAGRDVAVGAAFLAAKEVVTEQNKSSALAIAKSEAATTKQIDQMGVAFAATTQGINDKIDDVKDRIAILERNAGNVGGQVTGRHDTWSGLGTTIGVVGAAVVVVIALIEFIMHK